MAGTDRYREILRDNWGYDDFRGIQREIIESIGSGKDTLGLMPTGGGKSITFQVPALAQAGTCIVVTPLIALMKDQVQHLRSKGIKATAIYSGMSRQEILTALDNCVLGDYKFLYVSPERLSNETFQIKLQHMRVSFITVDEAHCISQWGYDFRPSYREIAKIRKWIPFAPVLALTASATPEVVDDIQTQLKFKSGGQVFRMSFERKNLTYIVRNIEDKWRELLNILRTYEGSAIIYTRSRKQTQDISDALEAEGISSTFYHAGLPQVKKDERQAQWQAGETRVMVATNAFGMGIDKPDVRLVIHVELPDSPEAYFQEAGRAGRDGEEAQAIMLYNSADKRKLIKRIDETYPDPEKLKQVYEDMCCYLQMAIGDGFGVTREFDLQEFCYNFKHFPVIAHSALLLLDKAGYIDYAEDDEITSRLMFTLHRDELYKLHEGSPQQEALVQTILRTYSGVFVDFAYIDEYLLSAKTGIPIDDIYHILIGLSKRRILEYIPRKRTNYIFFTCRRVEKKEIMLMPEIYADRKKEYSKRISTMIEYAENKSLCHSRFLLNYFGEKKTKDCGKCDICCDQTPTPSEEEAIRLHLRRQLAIKGPLFPHEINMAGFLSDKYIKVMEEMSKEEEIITNSEGRIANA